MQNRRPWDKLDFSPLFLTYNVIRDMIGQICLRPSGTVMRVNARFDGEYERQMEFLSEATGLGVSEVLKASVAHYYRMVKASSPTRLPNVSRLIGKQGSGRGDVSTAAKEMFAAGVAAKHSIKQSTRLKSRK